MNKKKAIKQITPISTALYVSNYQIDQDDSHRKDVFNTKLGNIIIDTVCPNDTYVWETGIDRGDDNWIIVEQYPDRETASDGHRSWTTKIKIDPKQTLYDIFEEVDK